MSDKKIHIVFQVINNLCHLCHVSNPDKLILITLASFAGVKGICPSASKIGKRVGMSSRHVYRSLKRLEDQKIIKITRFIGRGSQFELLFLSTTPDIDVIGKVKHTPDIDVIGTPDICVIPPMTYVSPYITKEVTKINNRERKRTKRAPLSPSWWPNEKLLTKATDVAGVSGIGVNELIKKFINLSISKEKTSAYWEGEFENFLINEKPVEWLKSNVRGDTNVIGTPQPNRSHGKDWTQERLDREAKEAVKPKTVDELLKEANENMAKRSDIPTPEEVIAMMRAKLNGHSAHGALGNDTPRDRDTSEASGKD